VCGIVAYVGPKSARDVVLDFKRVLVAVDGSEGSEKALDCAVSICQAIDATLTALAVEGKLPAYAGSIGEVDEVKHEKDAYFKGVLERAEARAEQRDPIPGLEREAPLISMNPLQCFDAG
jgi:nucleotide-binding universal stress UspA family protein